MPANLEYTSNRPKRHTTRVPIFWWVKKWSFTRFILRELSAVFVGGYAIVLLLIVRAVARGPEAYAQIMEVFRHPASVVIHGVALAFLLLHTVTWFGLAPKAMVVKLGKRRVPPTLIVGMNYAAWIVISAFLVWILIL